MSCQGLYKQVVENSGLAVEGLYNVRVKNPFNLSRDGFDSWEFIGLYGNSTHNWVGCGHLARPRNMPHHALPAWNSHMRAIKAEKAIPQREISSSRQNSARWRWAVPDSLSPARCYSSLKLWASTSLAACITCCGLRPSPGLHTSVRCAAAPAVLECWRAAMCCW